MPNNGPRSWGAPPHNTRAPNAAAGRASKAARASDPMIELRREPLFQRALEWHLFAAYRDAVAKDEPAFCAAPIVVSLPPQGDGGDAVRGPLWTLAEIAESEGFGFCWEPWGDHALAMMHGARDPAALAGAAYEGIAFWRVAEARDGDLGLLGPVVGFDRPEPALCRGMLPAVYRTPQWRPALHKIDLLRLSAASFLREHRRTFPCPVDLADALRGHLTASGGMQVSEAAWALDNSPPRFSCHVGVEDGGVMEIAATPGDADWDARLDESEKRCRRAVNELCWLPVALRVAAPAGARAVRLRLPAGQRAQAEAILRGCGGRKAALNRVFCSLGGAGFRFGSVGRWPSVSVFLVAGTAAAPLDAAVEALRGGGVDAAALPVSPSLP